MNGQETNLFFLNFSDSISDKMIDINDVTVRIGSRVLLDHASLHISDGQRVGIVGLNGCGKSTLFRVLRNEMDIETGQISFPNKARVVSVAQEFARTDIPILEYVLSHDIELERLRQALSQATDIERPDILERWQLINGDAAPAKAAQILNGLGFKEADLTKPMSEFSGGWRMRLALAAALFQPSTILLLDEPTNHLDLESTLWLLNHLKKYTGTLILVSHDRVILNELCDHIVHFDRQKLTLYTGNYDTFQTTYAAQLDLLAKQIARQAQKKAHLQSFVDRFRYKATKAKQAQSRLKQLEKMADLPDLPGKIESHFEFPKPTKLAPPLITLDGVCVGYGDKEVLKNLSFSIGAHDRIALMGANGNGKSTLAKLLVGRLEPMAGNIRRSSQLSIGYFAQHQTEELPLSLTPLLFMSKLLPEATETKLRTHLARFGLTGERALTRIEYLSGGEKARLLFAQMTIHDPALLILDEPTNHLDIQGREALIDALNEYGGSVILIAHDLNLIELVADDLWLVQDRKCCPFEGDLEAYKNQILNPPSEKTIKKEPRVPEKNTHKTHASAEIRQVKAKMGLLEKELEKLSLRKTELEKSFETPLSAEQIRQTTEELKVLNVKITEIEEKWLELSEKIV